MGKPKQKQHVEISPGKSDMDLPGDDGWVIVKKQRVTILLPPLTSTQTSIMPEPGPSKLEAMPTKNEKNKLSIPEACTRKPSVDEEDKVMPLNPNRDIEMAIKNTPVQCFSGLDILPRLIGESENPNQANIFKSRNMLGVSNISKTIKRPRPLRAQGSFLDGSMFLNQKLRASLLEKKLERAGGLSKWLVSIGLERFVRIFQGKSVNKFYLANLTMKKLKDMGADAVGPRRKLMHAIDCICQPYCFQAC